LWRFTASTTPRSKPRRPAQPADPWLKKLLLEGTELYRAESKNMETMAKYGYGTPDDWIERNLYTRYSWQGVA
jgi:stearoyl-CoA desaturase (delta-9 desaturase)